MVTILIVSTLFAANIEKDSKQRGTWRPKYQFKFKKMLDKSVLRLQKYVLEMEERVSGKNFSFSFPESQSFSYVEDATTMEDENRGVCEKKYRTQGPTW